MLSALFWTFLKIGLVSFGGGYAMIPLIRHEALAGGWIPEDRFTELAAIGGMAPGPAAINTATLVGYEAGGLPGALISTAGMLLPSLLIMIGLTSFVVRHAERGWVQTAFYGLRPVIAGMILYAGIHFISPGEGMSWLNWHTGGTLLILGAAMTALLKYKVHPLGIIVLSGMLGIVFF